MQSIPRIGPIWVATILAEVLSVFHPEEKSYYRKLVATAGLDVQPNESWDKKSKGTMSKRGSIYIHTATMQAAKVATLVAKDTMFKSVYEKQKDKGKNHRVAVSHVANKLLYVVFSVLKNWNSYELRIIH